MQDVELGERVLLLPFMHHDVASAYKASAPIFIREYTKTAKPRVNQIPDIGLFRLFSIRAYDKKSLMIDADVIEGKFLETKIQQMFENNKVDYLHLHYAKPGCFSCSVLRV